jgi:hypothetical protein
VLGIELLQRSIAVELEPESIVPLPARVRVSPQALLKVMSASA